MAMAPAPMRRAMAALCCFAGLAAALRGPPRRAAAPRARCVLGAAPTIGVDYGLKRTGVCVGTGWAARALGTVETPDGNATAAAVGVAAIAARERSTTFVVGLPLARNGTDTEQTGICRVFASILSEVAEVELKGRCAVSLWDERFSSREAAAHLESEGITGADLKKALDAAAACAILDDYFGERGVGAEVVSEAPPPPPPPPPRKIKSRPPASARSLRYLDE